MVPAEGQITPPLPDDDELFEVVLGPDDDSEYCEVIDGIHTEKPPLSVLASILTTYLATMINSFALPQKLGIAIIGQSLKLDDKNTRRPDVCYIRAERLPPRAVLWTDPAYFEGGSDLLIEVGHPTTVQETQDRLLRYFSSGVQVVWIVFPTLQHICVFDSPKSCKILSIDDILDGGAVLPGFSLKLAELFNIPQLFA